MKKASRIILIAAILSIIYGYWGAFTQSGNKVYDEMDAMLPFFVLIFGVILLLLFLVLVFIMKRKSKAENIDKPGKQK
jgi:NADH:ubiquinone oxidoreductase subunit 6 (subunit J)